MELNSIVNNMYSKMGSYSFLLSFRYMNLCVKAEAMSLLSSSIQWKGESKEIEEVAQVTIPDEYHFEIFPNEKEMLGSITAGILTAHPEFKPDTRYPEELRDEMPDEEYRTLVLEMPVVNDDRYDLLTKAVDSLRDEFIAQLDVLKGKALVEIGTHVGSFPAEKIDKAKAMVDERYDNMVEKADKLREMKLEEINDAHNAWLEKQNVAQTHPDDLDKALSMKLGGTIEE